MSVQPETTNIINELEAALARMGVQAKDVAGPEPVLTPITGEQIATTYISSEAD
ncbi:MAG: hypothetical protein RIS61_1072, partial [Actinomycetota bacterium]